MDATAAGEICGALRFLVRARVVDYNGHASRRVGPQGFVINTAASNRADPSPAEICAVDPDGEPIEGDRPPNEAHLHAAIYRARPDVDAVAHGHPKWLGVLSAADAALAPVIPQGALVWDMPIYPHAHSISTRERGTAVAEALGGGRGAVLRGHGVVTVGRDLVEAGVLALYAEATAERQVRAAPLGGARRLTEAELAEYRATLDTPALFRKAWDFVLAGGEV